jgi:hypothetical protein
MKCSSCFVEIPPTFLAAIRSGVCPSCNGQIMPPEFKLIYDEIRQTMSQMPNDPDGLAGWLLSNYHLEKIDPEKEVEPAKFYYPKQDKKQKSRQQKLTKQQQFYAQNFDPEIDDEIDESEKYDPSENQFFQQAGLNRSAAETQAILRKAKQGQSNDEWDPNVLKAIASMKPEIMDYSESETDFSTYEDIESPDQLKVPSSPQEALKQNLMRQNKSRAALSGRDPRGFRRSG